MKCLPPGRVELVGGRVALHRGDCLDLLPSLPPETVGAVLADPPYGMRNKTNSKRFSGGHRTHRVDGRVEGRDDWPEVAGDDRPFDPTPWIAFPKVCLWGANHFPERLPVGTTLVWIKRADHLFGSFLSDAEVAWMRGGHGVYCYRKQFPPSTRAKEGLGQCAHPNQKPIGLMEWALRRMRLEPDSLVFDPYMGSGTTALACLRLGYRYLGCEINPAYFAVARQRVEAALEAGEGPEMAPGRPRRVEAGPLGVLGSAPPKVPCPEN